MIVFTSAFYDIGRKNWGEISRTYNKYIEHFNNMINDGFEYTLVVYSHSYVIQEILKSRSYPPNIMFVDISSVETFLIDPYISMETAIMKDPSYLNNIPKWRSKAPEHTFPKYTLLTHSKMCFLKHTRKVLPNFTYYAWIDFGYPIKENILGWPVCTFPAVPKNINFSLLERKCHIGSIKLLKHHVSEYEFLQCNWFTFYAYSFIIHTDIMDEMYELYKDKLESWQKMCHADDEQNLLYQLYQDRKDLFKIFKIDSVWGLYKENLNMGAKPTILHTT